MSERRTITRTKARHPAVIVSHPGTIQACSVDNLTMRGACLVLSADAVESLPNAFHLSFDECRTLRSCNVVWRRRNRVGIQWR